MKKILVASAMVLGSLAFGQVYSNNYPDSGYADRGYGNYAKGADYSSFPDDYFYEFPNDYYPAQYYQSYYDDYLQSISGINWNRFFAEYNLSPWQMREIALLNRRFPSYSAWYSYYGANPDRWYYDRFYALQQILGPQVYVVFRNNYYRGYDPVVYFREYRQNFYAPRYAVAPRYRDINPARYRVNRDRFFENRGRFTDKKPTQRQGVFLGMPSDGGFNSNPTVSQSSNTRRSDGFRGQQPNIDAGNGGGFRNGGTSGRIQRADSQNGNSSGQRGRFSERMVSERPTSNSGGFRNSGGDSPARQGGFR